MTGSITIITRATRITSITFINMATIITTTRRTVAILPTENSYADGNSKDMHLNDVDHPDDKCKNDVVTVFRRENIYSVYSPEVKGI